MTDSEPKQPEANVEQPAAPETPAPPAAPAEPVAETPATPPAPEASTPVEPTPTPPVATETAEAPPRPPVAGTHLGTGRRKSSVARVRLMPGEGKVLVNKRPFDQYFHHERDRNDVVAPLEMAGMRKGWDVMVTVKGGGTTGQAGAVLLGVARAVIKAQPDHETELRNAGFLTRDARRVERKKYGHRKARRRFQFSKR